MNKLWFFLGFLVEKIHTFFVKRQEDEVRELKRQREVLESRLAVQKADAAQTKAVQDAVKKSEKELNDLHKAEQKALDEGRRNHFEDDF
jgi:cell division FtsZ-interacting protein ZapD